MSENVSCASQAFCSPKSQAIFGNVSSLRHCDSSFTISSLVLPVYALFCVASSLILSAYTNIAKPINPINPKVANPQKIKIPKSKDFYFAKFTPFFACSDNLAS